MKKFLATILIAVACFSNAANILWKVDIIGGSYSIWEGTVVDKNMTFVEYFEQHTIPGKAATDGIDLVAKTSSGTVLSWMLGSASSFFEVKSGVYLEKNGGDGYSYVLQAQQIVLDELQIGESVQIFAGYFDWDNVDYDLEIDEANFTPYAVATIQFSEIFPGNGSAYSPGDLGPPNFSHVFQWASVPEPSTISLLALGILALFRKTR